MRLLALVLPVAALAGAAAFLLRSAPEISPIDPPKAESFAADLVERGEVLARIGACEVCHTADGGEPYAGGLALHTPFGKLYSTNLTPDAATGIGRWSKDAFVRAMREGVGRDGSHLYPAFPYTHFAKAKDEDLGALYAFLMSLDAVKAPAKANELAFPFNQRALLAGWKMLFHDPSARFQPTAGKSDDWNLGAYHVQALGHCSACHTPRNALGAEKADQTFAGGEVDGMHAPAIGARARPVMPWTTSAMVDYLIDGRHPHHAIAAGPMKPVVDQLAQVPEDIVQAMAVHLTDGLEEVKDEAKILEAAAKRDYVTGQPVADPNSPLGKGEAVFAKSCANCHRAGNPNIPLALTTSVVGPELSALIRITLDGIQPPEGSPDKSMPKFASMSDEDLTHLVMWMRHRFAPEAKTGDVAAAVKAAREFR